MFTSRCATALWSRFRLQIVLSRRHGSRGGRGFLSVVLRLRHVASQGHPNSSQPSAIPSISAREPKISGKGRRIEKLLVEVLCFLPITVAGTEEILRVGKLVRSSLRSERVGKVLCPSRRLPPAHIVPVAAFEQVLLPIPSMKSSPR
uniref:Uncharacterized protein n=1 Tax=Solanum lycopersicum TaxID=4081 RepID=A0A3Q7GV37_SOLLC